MRILGSLCVLLFFLVSCTKSTNAVSGLYIENSPVSGRSQLNFISNTLLMKSETGSNYRDTFIYSISPNKISLTPTWTSTPYASILDFQTIDANSFRIENLYPSIPEAPKTYMIFKK